MRKDEAKGAPLEGGGMVGQAERQEEVGSRDHLRKEAVRKDQESAEAVLKPGPPPDPGIEEDYGKRAGEVPSQEPGNPKAGEGPEAT